MINAEVAEFVLGQIGPGETIEAYTGPESKLNTFELIECRDFAVIVASPGVKPVVPMELSVNKLKLYQDEIMRIQPPTVAAEPAAPKPRGRPPKAATAAANVGPQPSQDWQTETVQHPQMEGVRVMADNMNTLLKTTDHDFEDDFVRKAVTEACDNFKADMIEIISKVYIDNVPDTVEQTRIPETQMVKQFTCLHCVNMLNQVGDAPTMETPPLCRKFNIIPPLLVMCDANGKCPDFSESDFIPF